MSAVPVSPRPTRREPSRSRPTLRAVAVRPMARLSGVWFVVLAVGVLAVGMVGVLVLNITIQSQSRQLRSLQSQAVELGYQQSAYETQVNQLSSSANIAAQAAQLGMRPDPAPAFIMLPSGEIVGTPTPVKGDELLGLVPTGTSESAASTASASSGATR